MTVNSIISTFKIYPGFNYFLHLHHNQLHTRYHYYFSQLLKEPLIPVIYYFSTKQEWSFQSLNILLLKNPYDFPCQNRNQRTKWSISPFMICPALPSAQSSPLLLAHNSLTSSLPVNQPPHDLATVTNLFILFIEYTKNPPIFLFAFLRL